MTHRNITLTDEERTAALLCYLFTCLAWACSRPVRHPLAHMHRALDVEANFYQWITYRDEVHADDFGGAVLWAMRLEADGDGVDHGDRSSANHPEGWLRYVEHVVGYRTGPGNGHT